MKSLLLFLVTASAVAQVAPPRPPDPLLNGFVNPPQSARPLVWWHWMNGNISKEGIRADLTWMHDAGLGGVQIFDAALSTPQIVDHRIEYMTPEWKDDFRYATNLCDQFGFELAIAGSPGWSETGGPWVTAPQAMKKYVWSETMIEGGKPLSIQIAHPPTAAGRFQNTPILKPEIVIPQFYADAALIAFKTPADEIALPNPRFVSSNGPVAAASVLSDQNTTTSLTLPAGQANGRPWIEAAYANPVTVRSLTISAGTNEHGAPIPVELQAGEDENTLHLVLTSTLDNTAEETLSFPPTTAKLFRLVIGQPQPRTQASIQTVALNEFQLRAGDRVHQFEAKAGFRPVPDLYGFASPEAAPAGIVRKADVINLTGKLRPDGTLDWVAPAGRWTVLRIGYSLTGTTNHPATKEATGLEVDKLNHTYVKNYMETYLDSYRDTVGVAMMGRRGIRALVTDSWEAGTQNWTDTLIAQFQKRRGYDPAPWLPVLAGYIVEDAKSSDAFLWDLRKTISDLTADEHYGQVQASLVSRNMAHYGESHESGRAFIGDGMEVKKLDNVPMGAMWTQTLDVNQPIFRFNADDRESASVAHIYGQNLAAAESMTAKYDPWGWSPATLKPTADQEFLNGINRFAIHESSHQPLRNWRPGLTLGIYGQWFNRNETWARQARPWVDYLARNSFMLQQGRFVADILYFYGEDSNLTAIFRDSAPKIPTGFNFDYINADGLIHAIHTADGRLTTQSGMSYRVLVLDPYARHMSLPVLRAIDALVRSGATVAGPKPQSTPSLADDTAEFTRLANSLFGDGTGTHTIGRGKVFAGADAAAAVNLLKLQPDFTTQQSQTENPIAFIHRTTPIADLYFIDNRGKNPVSVHAVFRIAGKVPELWRAETGTVEPLSYQIQGGQTSVPLQLEPWGSAFVVFSRRASTSVFTVPPTLKKPLLTLEGPWRVTFQPDRGAPDSVTLPALISWPSSPLPGIQYYSGEATYTRTVNIPKDWLVPGSHLWLDLGDVRNLASININGHDLGTVWHTPFRLDATSALRPGTNTLKITVVNAWVNRLIGDQQPGATKYTHTDITPYRADSPLLPSGLLGPVQLLRSSGN